MAILPSRLRKRRAQLERGLARGWTGGHADRAKAELARIMATRKRLSEDRTIYDPAQSLSGSRLRGAVDSIVEGEVAPLRRQASGLEALGSRLSGQVGGVYADIARRAVQQAQGMQNLNQGSVINAQQGTQATADRLGQVQESVDSSIGRLNDPRSTPYRQQAVDALAENRAQAILAGQANENQIRASGESSKNFLAEMAASQAHAGAQVQGDIARTTQGRVGEVMGQIADVQGPGRTKILSEMRAGERQWLGEQAAFGIDRAKIAADTQQAKAADKLARQKARQEQRNKDRQYQLDREKFGADRADEMWDRRHPSASGGGSGGRTPSQIREDKTKLHKARGDVTQFNQGKGGRLAKNTANGRRLRERAITGLMSDYGYSRKRARQIVYHTVGFKKTKKRYSTAGS